MKYRVTFIAEDKQDPTDRIISYLPDAWGVTLDIQAIKPWTYARPGEIWELTYGGEPTAHVYTDRYSGEGHAFVSDRAIVTADDPDITAGVRIWPGGSK